MESFYNLIMTNTSGLYREIYHSRFFFIDYWSFIHVGSGIFLMAAAKALNIRWRWLTVLGVLAAYEAVEISFVYLSIHVFLPETLPDKVTDIVVGGMGALAVNLLTGSTGRLFFRRMICRLTCAPVAEFLAAFVISFFWVHQYGYHYNRTFLNSPVVNWWALTLWTVGLFAIMRGHKSFRDKGIVEPAATGLVWAISLVSTLGIEFIGYTLLGIRETGGHPPLVFGLIHGTPLLKLYYIFAAPSAIGIIAVLRRIAQGVLCLRTVDANSNVCHVIQSPIGWINAREVIVPERCAESQER